MKKIGFKHVMVLIAMFAMVFTSPISLMASGLKGGRVLKAGAAMTDVTPPLGLGIVGNYGDPPKAEHIHDPLSARTLVLDDGANRIVFVIVDNLGIPAWVCEAIKDTIQRETDVPISSILVTATHTHSAVSAAGQGDLRRGYNYGVPFDDYQKFLIRRIADGVRVAINNLQPAQIAWGSFDRPQHVHNRRWFTKEKVRNPFGFLDAATMNPGFKKGVQILKPAGPVDPEVSFIAIRTTGGAPMAVLANYSLHYVGGVPRSHISSDYFGEFAKRVADLLGANKQQSPFVGIMSNGTSGDINNINFAADLERLPSYKKIELVADNIAQGLVETYHKLEFKDWVPLAATATILDIEVRQPSRGVKENLAKIESHQGDEPLFHVLEETYLDRVNQLIRGYPEKIPVEIQVFKIGDLAISAIPFEVFAETGLELKLRMPFNETFTIGIANGYWGYLPTPYQHRLGGYETWLTANKVQLDASEVIVEELLRMANGLNEREKIETR